MEEFATIVSTLGCIFAPLAFLLLIGFSYGLGMEAFKLPGVSRGEEPEGKDWKTVPETVKSTVETVGAIVGAVGGILGIWGFLLPWAQLSVGGGLLSEVVSGLNGSMTGIALAFQSFVGALTLFSSGKQGATGIGLLLLLLSLFCWLVALSILATSIMSIRVISAPLKLGKGNLQQMARPLLILGVVSICLSLVFLAGMQATLAGIQAGTTSLNLAVEMGAGFWVTIGGLVLALAGAWMANILGDILSNWTKNLSLL